MPSSKAIVSKKSAVARKSSGLTKSERGRQAPTRVYFDLWQLAIRLANENGKLNFVYDVHAPQVNMKMISSKDKSNTKAMANYKAIKKIFETLKLLNEHNISSMKKKGKYNAKVTYSVPESF